MRTALLLLALCVMPAVATAAETHRIPLFHGVYSVEAPGDWYVEESDDLSGVYFAPEKDGPARVFFAAPNPAVGGDFAEYAGVQLGILFKMLGGGEVVEEEEGDFKGYPNVLVHFRLKGDAEGLLNVVDFKGAAMVCIAMAPSARFADFLEAAMPVMGSYELDFAAMKENEEELMEVAKQAFEEMLENLE